MHHKEKLKIYKETALKISEPGVFNYKGVLYPKDYILPTNIADKNIQIDPSKYEHISQNVILLKNDYNENPTQIRLHRYWHHLNSSQVLTLNFFHDLLNDTNKLDDLLKFFGIQEKATDATLELEMNDKSEIDVAIKLDNGKYVFIEVKYSESKFGPASSKTTDYASRKNIYYFAVDINYDKYIKHYQFVRNVILGTNGNYSVFLVPRFNKNIINDYERSFSAINNIDDFNVRLVFWEDLLEVIRNEDVYDKYFSGVTE